MTKLSPFRYFKTSPEIIRLAVMLYVAFLFRFGMWRTYSTNAGSMSVMKPYGFGGIGLARCSQLRSVVSELTGCVPFQIGSGTWMMALPGKVCLHAREGVCED
jgi:hypothetical protein